MIRETRRLPVLFLFLTLVPVDPAFAQSTTPAPMVRSIHSVGITVHDMDQSLAFYTKALSFEKIADVEVHGRNLERLHGVFGLRMRIVTLRLGEELLELTEYLAPRGRPMPYDSRGNDLWFQHIAIIVSDMDRAYQRLREHKVQHASSGPQRLPDWNRNASGIRAFYFKDPDGHFLEILQFPEDKGDGRWHRKTDRLFLGIDHTAIVVRDTDTSLRFYRDQLGLRVVGEGENHGDEQERLNGVFGARLRITKLRAAHGPAVELLEYLAPRDGRMPPPDSKANDLWHWQIKMLPASADAAWQMLRAAKVPIISPTIISPSVDHLDFSRGLLARDPDRHALMFVELK